MGNTGYMDFYTHILPLEDGPVEMETTNKLLLMAYQQGVRTILASPYNYPGGTTQDNEKVLSICKKVDEEAKNIDQEFQVLPGNAVLFRKSIASEVEIFIRCCLILPATSW